MSAAKQRRSSQWPAIVFLLTRAPAPRYVEVPSYIADARARLGEAGATWSANAGPVRSAELVDGVWVVTYEDGRVWSFSIRPAFSQA